MAINRTIVGFDQKTELAFKELDLKIIETRVGSAPMDYPFDRHLYIDSGVLYYYNPSTKAYETVATGEYSVMVYTSTDYSVGDDDDIIVCEGGSDITVTLPVSPTTSRYVVVSARGTGEVTIDPQGNKINGDAYFALTQYDTADLRWDSVNSDWVIT